ncbi:MAG: hypothetical protein LUF30_05695, partial [Lachnospiraceae bacterium]|nr:hypothetical protein [Lachnospiraceae bacterium]
MYVDTDDISDNCRCRMRGVETDLETGTEMNTEMNAEIGMEMNTETDTEMNREMDMKIEMESDYELTAGQRKYLPVKRAADVVLAGAASVVLAPLLGSRAFAIKQESP